MSADNPLASSPPPATEPILISQLPARYAALLQALILRPMPPAPADQLLQNSISAVCRECGIRVSGAELKAAAFLEPADGPSSPKVDRLRRGFCARNQCGAFYYDLFLEPAPGVDWSELGRQAPASEPVIAQSADGARLARWTRRALGPGLASWLGPRSVWRRSLAAVVLALALFFIYWHFHTPSWSVKPSPYRVNPDTISRAQISANP